MAVRIAKFISAGDIVTYTDFLGGSRIVYVTAHEDDIKNGRPGFEGHLLDDPDFLVWGYDSQVTKVIHPTPI